MRRMGVSATARASVGIYSTPADIDALVDALIAGREVFGL
jgi:cysteine desulfurase/selenocysteine lyase